MLSFPPFRLDEAEEQLWKGPKLLAVRRKPFSILRCTPLFLTALLDDLVARGMLAQTAGTWTLAAPVDEIAAHRPDSIKQLIDIQLDRLSPQEQRVLEAASLVGPVFQTALVAAALEMPIENADELCDGLARRALFLQHEGTEDWPDGSQQSCYGFTHGLVRDVCTARSAPARRQRWHRAIAGALETAYQGQTHEVSAVLAMHYEQAQSIQRALELYLVTAERMVKRYASGDALPFQRRALRLLERLPETRERDTSELRIRGGMAPAVLRSPFANDESVAHCERMIALARKLGDNEALCSSLVNLSMRYATLAKYERANEINVELVGLIASMDQAALTAAVHSARAVAAFWQGRLGEAMELFETLTHDETKLEADRQLGILDPLARKAVLTAYLGAACWAIGQPDRAMRELDRAGEMATERGDSFVFGLSRMNGANIRLLRGDPIHLVREAAESVLANPDAMMWHPQATMLMYWVRSTEAPLARADVDHILQRFRERHAELPLGTAYSAIKVVDALARSGFPDEARAFADEMLAFARVSRELMFEPELVRVRAGLTADRSVAVATLQRALADAERMGAHGMALRIAIDLVRDGHAGRDVLAAALARMVGGDQTADVRDAKRLLSVR